MKIVILSEEEIKKIYEEYRRKLDRFNFYLERDFVIKRYMKYFYRLKKYLNEIRVLDRRLNKVREFVLKLDKIYVSPYIYGGTAFRNGIIVSHDLLYKDFSFAIVHESFHFLFHSKRKVNRKLMEIEANSASLILLKVSPYFWKFRCYRQLYSFKLFKRDLKLLMKARYNPEIISFDDYLFFLKKGRIEKEKEYISCFKKLSKKIKKIKLRFKNLKKEKFPLKIIFWPESRFNIYDALYVPAK